MAPTTKDIKTEADTDTARSACKDTHSTSATTTFERLKLIHRGKEVLGYGQTPCGLKADIDAEVIKEIKTKLNTVMGSKLDASSGAYTYEMDSTVLAFQRKYDLAQNRYIGRETLGKLEKEYDRITAQAPNSGSTPVAPAPSPSASPASTPAPSTTFTTPEAVLPPKSARPTKSADAPPTAQLPQEQHQPAPSKAEPVSPDVAKARNADRQTPDPRNANPNAGTIHPAPTNDPIATAHTDIDNAIEYSKGRIKLYSDRTDAIIKGREEAGIVEKAVDSALMSGFRQSAADKELITINNGHKRAVENLGMLQKQKHEFEQQLKSDMTAQEKAQLATEKSSFARNVVKDDIEWRRNAIAELATAEKNDQHFAAKAAVALDAAETVGQIAQVGLAITGVGALATAGKQVIPKLSGPLRFFARKDNTGQTSGQTSGQNTGHNPGKGAGENTEHNTGHNTGPTTSPDKVIQGGFIEGYGHQISLKTFQRPSGTTYRVAEVESPAAFKTMLEHFRSSIIPETLDKIIWRTPSKP